MKKWTETPVSVYFFRENRHKAPSKFCRFRQKSSKPLAKRYRLCYNPGIDRASRRAIGAVLCRPNAATRKERYYG